MTSEKRQRSAMPRHIAIIMDGNGRWAKQRGLLRMAGHRAGVENMRRILTACVELGINPSNDGRIIRLALPPLTEERRRDLTKQVRARMEESKVALRNLRREALDDIKQLEHEKLISENDQRRAQEQLQTLTDKYIREADHVGAAKEAEVMEV
jgi:ribosome recycling factor